MVRVINFDQDKKSLAYVHGVVSGSYASPFRVDELALVPGGGFPFHSLDDPGAATPLTQALPFTAAAGTVRGTFASSVTLGAYLSLLFDDSGTGIVHTPCADLHTVESTLNRSLWRITGKTKSGATFDVGPAQAASFIARASVATTSVPGTAWIFEWRGVAIAGAPDGDTLWVRIAVLAPSGGTNRLCWLGWCGREVGNSARIETFIYPVIALQNYCAPDAAESELESGRRLRLLVPMNEQNTMPLQVCNMPVAALAQVGMPERTVGHIGPVWFSAFAATCSCTPFDTDNVRRIFMLQVRDGDDHHSTLAFRCIQDPSDVYVMLKLGQSVPFERGFARGPIEPGVHGAMLFPESTWGNSAGPRTIVELHAFQAATDDWWYDCADRYRTMMLEERLDLVRKINNPDLATFGKGPNLLIATMTFAPKPARLPYLTNELLQLVDLYLAAHAQSDVSLTNRVLVHLQLWQNGHQNVNNCNPNFEDIVPEVYSCVAALKERGVRVSLYMIAQNDFLDTSWYRAKGLDVLLAHTLDGSPRQADDAEGLHFVQYDRRDPNFHHDVPFRIHLEIVGKVGTTACYTDAFTGGVDTLGVSGGEGGARCASGNDQRAYVKGQKATIARLRELMRNKPNGVDPDFPVFAEAQQEGLPTDWQGGGYEMIPGHVDLGDETFLELIYGVGLVPTQFTDSPVQLRVPIPPIFQCINSRFVNVGRFSVTPTTGVLSTSSLQTPGHGLTAAQWLDSLCCAWAVLRIQGICSFLFGHNSDYLRGPATIDGGGNIQVHPENPTGEGVTFLAFSKALFQALRFDHAGQFLQDGTMQRPLQLDWPSGRIASAVNPASYYTNVYGRDGVLPALESFWFIYHQGLLPTGEAAFQVPKVLHSVWKANDDTIGIVLINWTSAAADWEGTVQPSLYGFGAGARTVSRLTLGGAPVVLGASAAATFTLRSAAAPGGTIYLGHLAARSITVLKIT